MYQLPVKSGVVAPLANRNGSTHHWPCWPSRWKSNSAVLVAPLDDLQWNVKAYFILGGAVRDAAVATRGIKGWCDCIRPISAIRYMADQGQSSDPLRSNYSPVGLPVIDGLIEVVEVGDPLAGFRDRHVGKIRLFCWLGPDYIDDPLNDVAGCSWFRAED